MACASNLPPHSPMAAIFRLLLILLSVFAFGAPGAVAAEPEDDEDWPLSFRIIDRFSAGDYGRVIADAPRSLAEEPGNNEVRFAYARSLLWHGHAWAAAAPFRELLNSAFDAEARLGLAHALAWTGRLAQAIPHYSSLLEGPLEKEARLGVAHAERWRGRPELALPHYRRAVTNDPDSKEAAHGGLYAERALRPRTVLAANSSQDSTPMHRKDLVLQHSWRDRSQTRIFSLEQVIDRDAEPDLSRRQREFSVGIEDLDMALAPRLDLSVQNVPHSLAFAHLRLKLAESPIYLNMGRVNWGKLAFNAHALDEGLTARRAGFEGKIQTPLGEVRGFINRYAISDGNRVLNGDVRLTPWWRLYGPEVRAYTGIAWRDAKRRADHYWSPTRYVVAYLGVEGEWETPGWSAFAFVTVGTRLAGEAAPFWSAGVNVKRWLDRDWAVGGNLWAQSNGQGENYRAHGFGVRIERLW